MNTYKRFTFLLWMLLLGTVGIYAVNAQTTGVSGQKASLTEWKADDETTFTGTIVEVVSKPPDGVPAGVNLQLSGTGGALCVNLGPRLGNSVVQNLTVGRALQVIGIVRQAGGNDFMLVREFVLDPQSSTGQKITVRSGRGFPAYAASASGNRPRGVGMVIGGAR